MDRSPEREMVRVGVLASGRGTNLQALLTAQDEGRLAASVVVVASDRADAAALDRARRHGVQAVHVAPDSARCRLSPVAENAFLAVLMEHGVEWLVLAGFFRIVGPVLLEAFPNRILNIHPSILPSFPGLHAQKQALDHGVRVTGCTVHLVNAEVDAGPILLQAAVDVRQDDTEDSLSSRILEQEHRILVEAVNRISTGRMRIEGRRIVWDD